MIKCPECGIEHDDNAIKCSFCGYKFRESPEVSKNKITDSSENKFNISAIFLGTIINSLLILFLVLIIVSLGPYYPLNLEISLLLLIPFIISNVFACWIGNSNYRQSIINGGLIAVLPLTALSLFGYVQVDSIIVCFLIGALAGILGKFITIKTIKNTKNGPNKKVKITVIFIFLILEGIIGLLTFIGTSNNIMAYDKDGISFNYIGELAASDKLVNSDLFIMDNNLTVLAAFNSANKSLNQSNSLIVSNGASKYPLNDYVNMKKEYIKKSNFTVISELNLTIDGVPATEIDYNNGDGVAGSDLLFIKNNNIYNVNFIYNEHHNSLQRVTVFLTVISSFKVK